MSWTYKVASGVLLDANGRAVATGYSGNGGSMNNPAAENVQGHGPIPEGQWMIGSFFDDPGGKGPIVAHLIPEDVPELGDRSGFMIHGDNAQLNHTASDGCIILPRFARQMIANSGDVTLIVTA